MAVGADTHWGAGPPARAARPVHGCGALTAALYAVAAGLRQWPSETVVRESTGVSGMALVAVRAARGCDVKLVAPHAVRQVPGRKTDGQEGQGLPERPPTASGAAPCAPRTRSVGCGAPGGNGVGAWRGLRAQGTPCSKPSSRCISS